MNVAALLVYSLVIASVILGGAVLLERALTGLRLPTRWVWIGALALSIWLPAASLVSAVGRSGGSRSATPIEVTPAASAPLAIVNSPRTAVGGWNGGSLIDRLTEWRLEIVYLLNRGAAVLPNAQIAPAGIVVIWGTVSGVVALILSLSLLRLRRRIARCADGTLLGRRVKISPDLGPATAGIFNPFIVLPRWASGLPPDELELVLRHEEEHVRSRDTLVLAVGLAAVAACPWNPVVWWQAGRLRAAVELDCDRRVLRGGVAPAEYGNLLLSLGGGVHLRSLAVPTMAGSRSLLERRLMIMKKSRVRAPLRTVLAAAASGTLLVAAACTADAPVGTDAGLSRPVSEDGNEAGTGLNADNGAASDEIAEEVAVAIRVARDGTVRVNDVVHPLETVLAAVAPLYEEGGVVSIEAHEAAPYRVLAGIQEHLREAGLLRVVFTTAGSEMSRTSVRDVPTLVDHGLAMVLPDTGLVPDPRQFQVSSRNLLLLEVRPTGIVAARRGEGAVQEIVPGQVEELWRREAALNPNVIAVVRTHPDAEYRHMYDVLEGLQRADATRFSLQLAH